MTGKHAGRVSEENLVRYYGFRAPPPVQQVEVHVHNHGRWGTAADGLGDILVGTAALVVLLVLALARFTVWVARGVAKLIHWIGLGV